MINITIAGDLGSGKSTVANHLISNINYRIESAGLIFRRLAEQHGMTAKEFNQFIESNPKYDNMVDDTIKEMGAKEENIIFDSRLAWYFVPKSFKSICMSMSIQQQNVSSTTKAALVNHIPTWLQPRRKSSREEKVKC